MSDSPMDETVVYEPQYLVGFGALGPMGLSDMRKANPSPAGKRSLHLRFGLPAA